MARKQFKFFSKVKDLKSWNFKIYSYKSNSNSQKRAEGKKTIQRIIRGEDWILKMDTQKLKISHWKQKKIESQQSNFHEILQFTPIKAI